MRTERWTRWMGPVAVGLWVLSIVVTGSAGAPAENAPDAEYLAYVEANAGTILLGGWIFMGGCAAFLWFAVVLRERLGAAHGAGTVLPTAAFVGAVVVGALMMLTPGGDIAAAIVAEERQMSAASVGALRVLGEAYLSAATFAGTLLMVGTGVVALRTRLFPKAWAWFSLALGIVFVIGPVGWAALLLGLPIWTIGTTILLRRGPAVPDSSPRHPGR